VRSGRRDADESPGTYRSVPVADSQCREEVLSKLLEER
jgi:hypothetical protein